MMRAVLICIAALLLSGCIARTAAAVVTAPVRAGAQVADWATTSQDEADREMGRKMRHRDEQLGELGRRRDRAAERCGEGSESACTERDRLDGEIATLRAAPLD